MTGASSPRVVFHVHTVLEEHLPSWLALGWAEERRDSKPSVAGELVVISWAGEGEPPVPQGHGENVPSQDDLLIPFLGGD